MPAVFSEESLSEREVQQAIKRLQGDVMFRYCSKENLRRLARSMTRCEFDEGDTIIEERCGPL